MAGCFMTTFFYGTTVSLCCGLCRYDAQWGHINSEVIIIYFFSVFVFIRSAFNFQAIWVSRFLLEHGFKTNYDWNSRKDCNPLVDADPHWERPQGRQHKARSQSKGWIFNICRVLQMIVSNGAWNEFEQIVITI